jgi:hypothetical protein
MLAFDRDLIFRAYKLGRNRESISENNTQGSGEKRTEPKEKPSHPYPLIHFQFKETRRQIEK